jgi:transitional endoplasmic reticulum ATPase
MASSTEQERKDAIKNVMLTKAHFEAAILKVRGSLDRDAIEQSERQAWQMLYNTEQRDILEKASAAISRVGMLQKESGEKGLAELRKATYQRKKDFALIRKLTESLDEKKKK